MQSIRTLAAVTGALILGAACGGDGGNGPTPPVANFTVPSCTINVACTFTDASTGTVVGWDWDFGDATEHSDLQNPSHTYTAAGTYQVTLVVNNGAGVTSEETNPITIAAAPNTPPTAGFTSTCNGLDCTFTNSSTDAPPGPLTYLWNFGEPSSGANNTSTLEDPTHTYTATAVTPFTVTLTVTDNNGATDVETQTVTVSPPAGLECAGVDCTLNVTSRSTITITLSAVACEFVGNSFAITAPIQETVFTDGCSETAGTVYNINAGAAFEAGTEIAAQFTQGAGQPSDPAKGPPATRVTGVFPDWTIEFDDGGAPTAPGEPDFNDIVLTVHATLAP
jgi:PKD repeat protein